GGGKLGQHPFAVVRRPNADAIARIKTKRQKPGGELVDGLPQLRISEPDILLAYGQRRARRPFRGGLVKKLPDGFADQWPIAGALPIAELKSGHCRSSRNFRGDYSAQPGRLRQMRARRALPMRRKRRPHAPLWARSPLAKVRKISPNARRGPSPA